MDLDLTFHLNRISCPTLSLSCMQVRCKHASFLSSDVLQMHGLNKKNASQQESFPVLEGGHAHLFSVINLSLSLDNLQLMTWHTDTLQYFWTTSLSSEAGCCPAFIQVDFPGCGFMTTLSKHSCYYSVKPDCCEIYIYVLMHSSYNAADAPYSFLDYTAPKSVCDTCW